MSPSRPTIAHVLHRLYLAGAEVLSAALARQLQDRYRFVFLCLDEIGPLGQELAGEGFTVIDLKRRPGLDLSVAKGIKAACVQHKIDLLHAHQYTPFFYSAASRLPPATWTMGGPPILFTEHGRHYPDLVSAKRRLANQFLLRRKDRVTAVGNFVKEALVNKEGLSANRIEVVHNGINPVQHQAIPPDTRATVRTELGISPDQPVILQVARFHPVKDHETAVRAFAQLLTSLKPQISGLKPLLLQVGDGPERGKIESLVKQLGVIEQVRFLGVRSDVQRLLPAADIFLLSSLSEGISVTLLEAMAAGLPIATTDVGGNSEVVVHEKTGLLSPRREAAALATNLKTLLDDANMRARFGAAGTTRMLEQFTEARMHQLYAQIYDQMLSTHARPEH